MIGETVLHYKILEKLGQGGMGVVYKGEDLQLRRSAALKFLAPHVVGDADNKKRFIREAQTAASLDHPNICTIYEIGEVDEQTFIAMALVDGQSLEEKMQQNLLSVEEGLDFAIQIAEGLREAHENGVVHRDIKPANIMLTSKGQAKITDFGLAMQSGRTKLTIDDITVGTIAYISPEQARGEDVDHRTDVWSFGVMLYEMFSGELPFKGEYEQAVIYAILNETPAPVSALRSDLPAEIEKIIEKCLVKNRDERFQDIDELLADLKDVGAKPTERVVQDGLPPIKSSWKKPAILAAAAVVFLIAAAVMFSLFSGDAESDDRVRIAVVDVLNETDEKELDGLSGLLITALEQSRRLSVLTRSRMFDALQEIGKGGLAQIDERTGREIARHFNVQVMAVASVRKLGKLYAMDMKVFDLEADEHLFTTSEQGRGQESVLGMIDKLAARTRKDLQEKAAEIQQRSRSVAEMTTIDLDAYQHYFLGSELFDKLKFPEARDAFKKAIAVDSTFGLAHYMLAFTYAMLDRPRAEVSAQCLRAADFIDGIPEREQYLVRAGVIAANENFSIAGLTKGVKILEEMQKTYPDDKGLVWTLGGFYLSMDDYEAAEEFLYSAIARLPGYMPARFLLGQSLMERGDFGEAEEIFREIMQQDPTNLFHFERLGWSLFRKNKLAEAEKVFRRGLTLDGDEVNVRRRTLNGLATTLHVQGKNAESEPYFRESLALEPNQVDAINSFGWALFRQGKFAQAETIFSKGVALDSQFVFLPDNIEPSYINIFKGLSLSRFRQNKFVLAEAAARTGLSMIQPSHADRLELIDLLAGSLTRQRKFAEAETNFRAGLKENPNHLLLLNGLGWNDFHQRKYAEAEKSFRRVLELEPGYLYSLDGLGWSLFWQGKYAEAKPVFQNGARAYPKFASFLDGLGWCNQRQSNLSEAEQYFRDALTLNANLMSSQEGLGRVLMRSGEYDKAEPHLLKAFQADSSNTLTTRFLGYLFAQKKQFNKALIYAEKAFQAESVFPSYNLLAWVLVAGDFDTARGLALAQKARELQAEQFVGTAADREYLPLPAHTLGLAFEKTNDLPKALEHLRVAVSQLPDRASIRIDLQRIEKKTRE